MKMPILMPLLMAGSLAMGAGGAAAQDQSAVAKADLKTQDGKQAGVVNFVETPNGVLINGEVEGVEVGAHGFHIHETGECEGDFTSAGDHFAPGGNEHGFANDKGYHAGDMPNIFVLNDGYGEFAFFNTRISLGEGENSINDDDGSAVIVHAEGDSYLSEAKAGGRVACGVVQFEPQ